MPVPSDITALSTTAASNSPPGSESPSSIDDYLRSHASFIAQLRAVIGGAIDANIPSDWISEGDKQSSASDATSGKVLVVGATNAALGSGVASVSQLLGVNQTWNNVTGSRALNTVYTNSAGKPIQIKVSAICSSPSVMQIFINGSDSGLPGVAESLPEASAIIPNGATYRALNSAGTASALNWWELS